MSTKENLTPAYSFTLIELAMLSAAWLSLSRTLAQRGPQNELEHSVYVHGAEAVVLSEKLDRIVSALL